MPLGLESIPHRLRCYSSMSTLKAIHAGRVIIGNLINSFAVQNQCPVNKL